MDPHMEAVFFEIHTDLPREGPGSAATTRRAFEMIPGLPDRPRILDAGCGPGKQTFDLAALTEGVIHAVDMHQPYIDRLAAAAAERGLAERIRPRNADMLTPPFPPGSFDLIWAEASIYTIGFEAGLRAWRPLLAPGGHAAVSELCWLRPDPPREALEFWLEGYPDMSDRDGNAERIERAGYRLIADFVLPASDWWTDYYTPIEARLATLRERHAGDDAALAVLDAEQAEIDLYRRHGDAFGYVFFVMQRD